MDCLLKLFCCYFANYTTIDTKLFYYVNASAEIEYYPILITFDILALNAVYQQYTTHSFDPKVSSSHWGWGGGEDDGQESRLRVDVFQGFSIQVTPPFFLSFIAVVNKRIK